MTDTTNPNPSGKTYYLCGRMTGLPAYNFPAFNAAASTLRAMGLAIINPAENFDGDVSLERHVYLRKAFSQVALCDGVIRLPGWELSDGANKECEIARWCNIPLYDYEKVLDIKLD